MRLSVFLAALLLASCSQNIYVVRHAEKAAGVDPVTMTSYTDPPLTPDGQERAQALRQRLAGQKIRAVFSTNTLRTLSTARPVSELYPGLSIGLYSAKPDSLPAFVARLRAIRRGDVLVVGHSNTVDDLVNALAGRSVIPGDLSDKAYDNLFILKKKGKRFQFRREQYGKPSVL